MCFSSLLAGLVGLSAVNCEAAGGLGPDPLSRTEATEIVLPHKEAGYLVTCPRATADCISRAQAICRGGFRVVAPSGHGPRVQALVNLNIAAIDTDNPGRIRIVCE